ncbi:MAG TPA: cation:proton antiporter [Methylocystis sp.]|nr:cation:proton antiporter [Methylocystis sp.]
MMLAQDLMNPLILLGVILLLGALLGAVAERLSAPWIIGSMIAGVLLGPEALGVLSRPALAKLGGFSQASLAVIAFCIGSRLTLERLRTMGASIAGLAIAQLLVPLLMVFGAEALIGLKWQTALIVAAAAPATAPTITYAVIRRRDASGPFVDRAFGILAINDAATVLIFSVVSAATVAALGAHGSGAEVRASIEIAALNEANSLLAGGVLGGVFLIARSAISDQSPGCADRLHALLYSLLLLAVGMAAVLGLSPLLVPLSMGVVIANGSSEPDRAAVQGGISNIEEPLYIIFFVLAGAHLPIDEASKAFILLAAAVYVLGRFAGKYAAIYLASLALRLDAATRKYLGLCFPSQGGLAMGLMLAFAAAPTVRALEPDSLEMAETAISIVLMGVMLSQLFGPLVIDYAVRRACSAKMPGRLPAPSSLQGNGSNDA